MLSGIHCLHAESGGRRLCEYPASASRHSAVTDFDMLSFVVFYFVFVLCMGFVERQGPFFTAPNLLPIFFLPIFVPDYVFLN